MRSGDVLRSLKSHLDAHGHAWALLGAHALAALLESTEVDRGEVQASFEQAGLTELWHELS